MSSTSIARTEYDMAVVRGFALSALLWGCVGMLVGLLIALQLAFPAFTFRRI